MKTVQEKRKVVVGVDGSPDADAALRVGYEESRTRGAELVVVHAWQFPPFGPGDDDQGAAEDRLASAVRRLRTSVEPGVPIVTKLVGGDARYALVAEARDAALVVVGTRGLGRLSAAVLGSVSTYVVHHAACPVVVVPPSRLQVA